MAEIKQDGASPQETTAGEPDGDLQRPAPSVKTNVRSDGLIAWAVISIGFLAFIALGSVDARIWRFNNLRIEPRSVLRVWTLQAETLPTVSQQWLLTTLFYTCIILVIVSAVIGIWLLLDSAGTGLSKPDPNPDQDYP
jgi:hypothetical protein